MPEVTIAEFEKWQMRANNEARVRVRKANAAMAYAMAKLWDWTRQRSLEEESDIERDRR
jgi:hypothetical protein